MALDKIHAVAPMSLILVHTANAEECANYCALLRAALPAETIQSGYQPYDPDDVEMVITWRPPAGFFTAFTQLKYLFALGAGIDALTRRQDIAQSIKLFRLSDAGMAQQMIEYARFGVLAYQRQMWRYPALQRERVWQPLSAMPAADVRILVLGVGALGSKVADALHADGYQVCGWRRTAKPAGSWRQVHGIASLDNELAATDVVVNLLPLTDETRLLLNAERLALLPAGAGLINSSRGAVVDEHALVSLLQSGHLAFALLDVFEREPLPDSHPLWRCENAWLTPHIAATTIPEQAVKQIAESIEKIRSGVEPEGWVSPVLGY